MNPDEKRAVEVLDPYAPRRSYALHDEAFAARCRKAFEAELNAEWQAFMAAALSLNTLPAETVLCGLAGMFAAHAPPSLNEVSYAAR